VAKARSIEGLTTDVSYRDAATRIVAVRAQELVDHAVGVLDLAEIERLHDMRVATRRLRASLEVFEACFPAKAFDSALEEVEELADALGERRDRDVAIEAMESFEADLSAADRRGVESLVSTLRDEQAEANEALAPHVAAERVAALHERLKALIGELEPEAPAAPSGADTDGQPAPAAADEVDTTLAVDSQSNGAGATTDEAA
jgi:CHAD domain-containing protein